ncbi:MAG TPA: ABC transporter permease [Candidatus Dormibacteraeota bacterium]|nr:ABC transporter permease [Candidatus Dormibacteraeota bacterium]
MIAGIKAEFRKLFSVRSTYILIGLALVYVVFYNFYIIGWRGGSSHDLVSLKNPLYLVIQVARARGIAPPILFSSIIAVLLMAHEYRYSTIMYTLTSSNSRSKTLAAKIIAITGFTLIFSAFVELLSPSLAILGLHAHHLSYASQTFYYREFIWRVLFYCWAYAMIAILLAIFFRNLVASIVSLFLLPVTVEPLIGLLLNTNQQQYLPFTALSGVLNNGLLKSGISEIPAGRSALVVLVYLVIGWTIGWMLFLRRDAN